MLSKTCRVKQMRIVLVEDNEGLAQGIENSLRDQGHAVDWLSDGVEASRFLEAEGADIAIIDVNLPGLSGVEIVRALRKRGGTIPVIMLTARVCADTIPRSSGIFRGGAENGV